MAKLKKELIEENNLLHDKLSKLEQLMESLMKNQTETPSNTSSNIIPMTKIVKVVSLYNGILNLKTSNSRDSTIFKFNFFGDEQPIFYSDVVKCISMQQRFFKDGFCMILDEEIVKAHYLQEYYKDLLTKEQIDGFLEFTPEEIDSIYPKLTVQQKITVLERIAMKINEGKNVDRNKIDVVQSVSQVKIYELADKLK